MSLLSLLSHCLYCPIVSTVSLFLLSRSLYCLTVSTVSTVPLSHCLYCPAVSLSLLSRSLTVYTVPQSLTVYTVPLSHCLIVFPVSLSHCLSCLYCLTVSLSHCLNVNSAILWLHKCACLRGLLPRCIALRHFYIMPTCRLWLVQITGYSSYMEKIAFTYNSGICMILFLPDFECIDFLCMVDAWWGMESV